MQGVPSSWYSTGSMLRLATKTAPYHFSFVLIIIFFSYMAACVHACVRGCMEPFVEPSLHACPGMDQPRGCKPWMWLPSCRHLARNKEEKLETSEASHDPAKLQG